MYTTETSQSLSRLFLELVDGTSGRGEAFVLNTGDVGLLRSLEKLSASDASASVNEGATIAAHVLHVSYGLSLMNRWARDGGNPFADAKWDEAWKTSVVDASTWAEIRAGLRDETQRWLEMLQSPRECSGIELTGMMSSVAHLAYHLGAIRQIRNTVRGPKEGTFQSKDRTLRARLRE
jgi:hypothetical protein